LSDKPNVMRIIFITFFLLSINVAFSQTVTLPDNNMRDKLIMSYPQVMQGNQLDISKAAALSGTLNLTYANISDATGIQYFTNITTLDLSHNVITTFPNISALTNVNNFYASFNNLTSLPDMSALTQLHDFQVMNNQLTALPNLSGATGLLLLYCSNNNIRLLPPLTQFPNLTYLVVGNNPFSNTTFDASPCIHLIQLHIHQIGINTILGLDKLTNLSILYIWGNNLTAIPGIDANTTLTKLFIENNPLSVLPNLTNKPLLNVLDISQCLLTFENIAPILQSTAPATFTYAPQRNLSYADITARAENNYTLSYPVNSPLSTNMYVWSKGGSVIDSSNASTYSFTPIKTKDAGIYSLKVYNTSMPTLVLQTNTFNISILPCLELKIPNVFVTSKDCSKGYTIDFSQNQISGGTAPFQYQLSTSSTSKLITYPIAENIEAGNYSLTIIDSKNCRATSNFGLSKIENCDPVLTPNGDGITDTYFIEKTGKVSVYGINRELVNTLQAPIMWDGTDRNGALLDAGFYILMMEGQKPIYLTIIR
jgi:internalin A